MTTREAREERTIAALEARVRTLEADRDALRHLLMIANQNANREARHDRAMSAGITQQVFDALFGPEDAV